MALPKYISKIIAKFEYLRGLGDQALLIKI